MASEIISAIKQICEEKNISFESVVESIERALAAAYRKDFGQKNQNIKVEFHPETGEIKVFDVKTIVEKPEEIEEEELGEESEKIDLPSGLPPVASLPTEVRPGWTRAGVEEGALIKQEEGEEKKKFNPKTEIILEEAQKLKKNVKIGDEIKTELELPSTFGRVAAQTAKQVITQGLKEAEKDALYQEFKEKQGKLINGVVQRMKGDMVLVDIDQITAFLPFREQIRTERYEPGQKMKFLVQSIEKGSRGPMINLSRNSPLVIKELFASEIPEIQAGTVEIKSVAREAGARSKIAVVSHEENVDPIGSCIGQKGARVQVIISELSGEKIDIIQYNDELIKYISNALAPAKVVDIILNEKQKIAQVMVRPEQLSLAIGKGGQNVRLASQLTGWRIEIKEKKEEEKESKDKNLPSDQSPKALAKEEKEEVEEVKEKKEIKKVTKKEEKITMDKKEKPAKEKTGKEGKTVKDKKSKEKTEKKTKKTKK